MQINVYNNKSDNEEVHKNISSLGTYDCAIFGDMSIISPRLLITMSDNIISANYLYIPKFNRYYYITDKTIYDGNEVVLDCKCDVLMSFWDDFKGSLVIAERSSSNYDKYIPDNMIPFSTKMDYEVRKLPFTFSPTESGMHYVLTLGGNI